MCLIAAKYRDVIERDMVAPRRVVRLCMEQSEEIAKCELLKVAAYSRDIRPRLACVKSLDCLVAVQKQEAEVVVVDPHRAVKGER